MRDSTIKQEESFDKTYTSKDHSDTLDGENWLMEDLVDTQGRHLRSYDRAEAAARHIRAGTINKYYIKADEQGVFFDPYNVSHMSMSLKKRHGMPIFRMQQVKAHQFTSYIEYLKTKEKIYYNSSHKDW